MSFNYKKANSEPDLTQEDGIDLASLVQRTEQAFATEQAAPELKRRKKKEEGITRAIRDRLCKIEEYNNQLREINETRDRLVQELERLRNGDWTVLNTRTYTPKHRYGADAKYGDDDEGQ